MSLDGVDVERIDEEARAIERLPRAIIDSP